VLDHQFTRDSVSPDDSQSRLVNRVPPSRVCRACGNSSSRSLSRSPRPRQRHSSRPSSRSRLRRCRTYRRVSRRGSGTSTRAPGAAPTAGPSTSPTAMGSARSRRTPAGSSSPTPGTSRARSGWCGRTERDAWSRSGRHPAPPSSVPTVQSRGPASSRLSRARPAARWYTASIAAAGRRCRSGPSAHRSPCRRLHR